MTKLLLLVKAPTEMWATTRTKNRIGKQQGTTQSSTDGIQESLQKHDRKLSEKYGKSAKENQRGEPRGYNR